MVSLATVVSFVDCLLSCFVAGSLWVDLVNSAAARRCGFPYLVGLLANFVSYGGFWFWFVVLCWVPGCCVCFM